MKQVLLTFFILLLVVSCGSKEEFGHLEIKKEDSAGPSSSPAKLEIDLRTITNDYTFSDKANTSNFIKDISKVNINERNSDFIVKGDFLFQFTMIDELRVGLRANSLVHQDNDSMNLSFSAVHLRKINLKTLKVEQTKIFDNFFNKESVFPAVDGEFWAIRSRDMSADEAIFLFNKVKSSTVNCKYGGVICELKTDQYIVAHYDLATNSIRSLKSLKGDFRYIKYYDNSVNIIGSNLNEVIVTSVALDTGSVNSSNVQKHQVGKDQLGRSYFNNRDFYITGLWTNGSQNYPELMKFDRDLNIKDEIAFNTQLSGPDYNIDVLAFSELKEENYFYYSYANSIGLDNILVFKSYLLSAKKMITDLAIIDSTSGKITSYFNGGKVLRTEYVQDEFFYNDSNYIYAFHVKDSKLLLKSYFRDGKRVLINGAMEVSFQLDTRLTNASIRYVSITNGVATIALVTKTGSAIRRFNIH